MFSPSGRIVAKHRKVFPWYEDVARGTQAPPVFSVPHAGKLGLMICYDGWFPEMPRGLALRGAEAILHPTLTTTTDREQELVIARANAIANQCYVLNVNAVPTFGGGRSIGVDPEGHVLFEMGQTEEFAIETIDFDRVRRVRRHGTRGTNPLLRQIREAPRAVFEPYRGLPRRR